jgi:hypothetical protein
MLRRMTPSSAQLTGGDLSVDILHTEDSVALGDGTNLIGTFALVESKRALPTQVLGVAKTKITDSTETDFAEIEDVGGEKALKVSVIASVGGGGGGTAATDSAAFTATATQGTPIMGALDDTASDALAEGEMGVVRVTSGRALHVAVQNTVTTSVSGSVAVTGTFWQATQPVSGTVAVTNANLDAALSTLATDAKLNSVKTAVELIDDGIATVASAITSKGMAAVGTDGTNARILKTDSSGELQVDVLTMPTVAVTGTFWQATQPVSGTVTANLAAGTNNIGDVDVLTLPALPAGTNNIGDVDVLTLPSLPTGANVIGAVTQSGTWNVGTVTTLTSITNAVTVSQGTAANLKAEVVGSAAHDNGSPGVPIMVAARANNANPTSVAAGDVTYLNADLAGRLVTTTSDRALVTQATGSQATTTEATMLSAGGAGVFLDLTSIILTNSNTTTAAQVQIRDASTGTIRFEHMVPPNSGMVINFPTPFVQTTANNAWTIDLNAAVSTVYWTVQAIKRVA